MKNLKYLLISLMLLNSNLVFSGINISKEITKRQIRNLEFEKDAKEQRFFRLFCQFSGPFMYQELEDAINSGEFELDYKNEFGVTPLIASCMGNNKKIVKLLIELGADINIKNKVGQTAFEVTGDQEIKNIIEKTQDGLVNEIKESFNQLNESKNDQEEKLAKIKIQQLLKRYSIVDPDGNTILHYAAIMNTVKTFNYIWNIRPDLFNKKNDLGQVPVDLNPQIIMHLHYLKLIGPK